MRITFLQRTANFSGGNRVVATYAERLARLGHEVIVVSGPCPRPRPLRVLANRVRGRSFPVHDGRSWLDGTGIEHRVLPSLAPPRPEELPDADVLVSTWWETAEWVAAMPPSKGAKASFLQGVEWTIEGMPSERVRQTWRLPLHKIVISEFMIDVARREFGDDVVSYVPNAVDTALFHAPPRTRNATPVVGWMEPGPLAIKGGDVVHEALRLASARCPELRGVCFGRAEPPPSRPLPAFAEFTIAPSPEALRTLYARCDVFVHGARVEGFGLPILEAMACRTPVVATPAGAAPELVPSGGGRLVPHEDAAALAEALLAIAQAPREAWEHRSEAAYARATRHTLDDATRAMEAALVTAIERAASGSYARPSACGDRGPAPFLASAIAEARAATSTGGVLRLPSVLDPASLVRPSALLPEPTGDASHDAASHPSFVPYERLPAEAAATLDALVHPATIAALEDQLGVRGRLVDPRARDVGALLGAQDEPMRGFVHERSEPPLRRVHTVLVPLDPRNEVRIRIDGTTHAFGVDAGDLLVLPAGPGIELGIAGLRALVLPLYLPALAPLAAPDAEEPCTPDVGATVRTRAGLALGRLATELARASRRAASAARDRWLGLY